MNKTIIKRIIIVILVLVAIFLIATIIEESDRLNSYNKLKIQLNTNKIQIEAGDVIGPLQYVSDSEGTLNVEKKVNTNRPGIGQVIYKVYNKYLKYKEESMIVEVVDTTPPIIVLNTNNITIPQNTTIDFYDYLVNAYDNSHPTLLEQVIIDDSRLENKPGTYGVYYSVEDSSGNRTVELLTVNIK